jgi:hypothetical protein
LITAEDLEAACRAQSSEVKHACSKGRAPPCLGRSSCQKGSRTTQRNL